MSKDNSEKKFFKRRKFWIKLLLSLASVVIIITILGQLFLDSILKGLIKSSVEEASDNLYELRIDKLDFDFWTGGVQMDNIVLDQNEEVLEQMREESPEENLPAIDLHFESAHIYNFKWINYLIEEDLQVGLLEITKPKLSISGSGFQESLKSTNENFLELLPGIIAGFAGSLQIRELIVKSGEVDYESRGPEGSLFQKADSIYLDITEIEIDTAADNNNLYSEDIKLRFKDYLLVNEPENQRVSIDNVVASLSDSIFWFTDFYLTNDHLTKSDSTNLKIDFVKGQGVNFRSFIRGKSIIMDTILIQSPDVYYVSDTRTEEPDTLTEPLASQTVLVPDMLSGVLQSFNVDLIDINDGKAYSQQITNNGTTINEADDIGISIVQVSGNTQDTLNLDNPEQVTINLKDYRLYMSDPNLDIAVKSFQASTISGELMVDSLLMGLTENLKGGGQIVIQTGLNSVKGTGFEFKTVLNQQKVIFDKVFVNQPDVNIQLTGLQDSGDEDSQIQAKGILPEGIPEGVSDFVRSFEINEVEVSNGNAVYFALGEGDPVYHNLERVDFTIDNLHADTPESPVNFSNLNLDLKEYTLLVGREDFSLKIEDGNVSSTTSSALFKNVVLNQDHPPGIERNHYTVNIPEVNVDGFDVVRIIERAELAAEKLTLNNMEAAFLIHVGEEARPPYAELMPNEMVQNIGVYFNVDTVDINNALVSHKDATVDNPTITEFKDSEARILNLTNDPQIMSPSNPAVMRMKTEVMGEGTLYATLSIPLLTDNLYGHYEGIFTGMSAEPFNPALRNADIRIESGVIDSAFFNFDIQAGVVDGQVKLLYNDLDVAVLSEDGDKSTIKSFLGRLVVKNSNPDDPGDDPEVIDVTAERGPHDSFFYLIWKPVMQGIIKTVARESLLPGGTVQQ